ncbi:magnesium-translocating P-type ATPase [Ensifer sp. SL37]|uniref:magnesium-translocating P-type ATPase n=1 Tax=Ensifer sp. SL37 TaxID=2995137 RepID=UPI002273C311|nr:magnesium-translocating P-type ATPase [Ensifer sp. SL37]MCY1746299.1 magnesium-translocating P-type ATPase [Ensifer sp. SL37]
METRLQTDADRAPRTFLQPDIDGDIRSGFWAKPAPEVMRLLGTLPKGLSSTQAHERWERYGPNVLEAPATAKALRTFVSQFMSPLVLVLVIAAAIAMFVGDMQDAVIIWVIVVFTCILSFVQEYRASGAMERLKRTIARTAIVLREGSEDTVPVDELVPGDIIRLEAGSLIPADSIVINAVGFEVDESILTGEAFPAAKAVGVSAIDAPMVDRSNVLFAGTSARSGSAKALVVNTGRQTEFAKIAVAIERQESETDFARGIRQFGYLMVQVMLTIVIVVLAANVLLQRPIIDSLLFSLALAVGLTPELLPAIIAVTLARGALRMEEKGVIVRRLAAIENLGSMDLLCTDKTGTLTEGVIRLSAAVDVSGTPAHSVIQWAGLNATMETGLPNPLDEAIRASVAISGLDLSGFTKVWEVPYDFARKRLSVICRDAANANTDLMVCKGALTSVIEISSSISSGAETRPLSIDDRASIERLYRKWSDEGHRVLGIAIRQFQHRRSYGREDEADLTFVGFLLFQDTPKQGVSEVLKALAHKGVRTKIISGDNRYAVCHLAREIGLPHRHILAGKELLHLSDDALFARASRTDVYCEIDPNQKERIVRALRRRGHVVGYLGDGINDAPALKMADVGVSVESAVDVAREAADIVLLRKDLRVLLTGIDDGRRTFVNTMKYISITTSANFGNMISMACASLFLPFLPLLAKQILLNNFLSDIPALAIAGDSVDKELTERPPQWDIADIRRFTFTFGLTSSFFDLLTFAFLIWGVHASSAIFQTAWFVVSLLTELGIIVIIRTRRPAWKSAPSRALLVLTTIVAALGLLLPYQTVIPVFGFVPLPMSVLGGVITITVIYMVSCETLKHLFIKHRHFRVRAMKMRVVP